MSTSSAGVSSDMDARGLQLNQDLVNQLNELLLEEYANSEYCSSSRPVLIEGLLWSVFGAILWVVTLYIVS
jgi:hypothetical protein